MNSPLKWPGGKSWLGPRVERLIREIDPNYVAEPFCGGMSFSLHFGFNRVLANDLNAPLINFYRHVQNGMKIDPSQWSLNKEFYYDQRERLNEILDTRSVYCKEAAQIFWYINKHGFNGLMRMNQKGRINVPLGDAKKVAEPIGIDNFYQASRRWRFIHGSYIDLNMLGVKAMIADPPYAGTFTNYSQNGFTWEDQIRLADWLADHDMPIIACNSDNFQLAREYKRRGFSIYKTLAPRSISRNGKGRGVVPEMIAFKGFGANRKFSLLVNNIKQWRV